MNSFLRTGVAISAVLMMPVAAIARESAPVAVATSGDTVVVKMGTAIPLKTTSELNSKTTKTGERFTMTVASDVVQDGQIVIPAGSVAAGEVTKVTKKGAFGRSGKIEARILYLDVAGQRVELTGMIDSAGQGNTTGTVAAAVMVGVFSAFVTGKSAVMPAGYLVTGYTAGETSMKAVSAAPAQ